MIVKIEFSNFQPWSGAEDWYEKFDKYNLLDTIESSLEDVYPDGIDETELNDLFWFDNEWLASLCGIRSEDEIREDLSDLENDYENEYIDDEEYSTKYDELHEELEFWE